MASGMDFRKLKLGEHTDPLSLCICQYRPPEGSHCSRYRTPVSLVKGLNFITNDVFLSSKFDGNYNW